MSLSKFKKYLEKKQFRTSTIRQYTRIVNLYTSGKLNIENTSYGWRHIVYYALKNYYEFKRDKALKEFIDSIPKYETPPKYEKPPLTVREWQLLFEHAKEKDEPYRAVILTMLYSGLRIGDIGRIRRDKLIEAENIGQIYIELKRGKWKNYPYEAIREFLNPLIWFNSEWEYVWQLFGKTENTYYFQIYNRLREWAEEVGINRAKINPHLLRKTFATMLLMKTQNIEAVRQLLCHANIQTTQRYVSKLPQEYIDNLFKQIDEMRMGN